MLAGGGLLAVPPDPRMAVLRKRYEYTEQASRSECNKMRPLSAACASEPRSKCREGRSGIVVREQNQPVSFGPERALPQSSFS